MEIPTILPPGGTSQIPASNDLTGGQNLDQDDFLLMLVTQLSNQDPLNPLEGHEFAAQLAEFTSVEQLLSLNENLTGQAEMFTLLAEAMSDSLVAQGEMLSELSNSLNRSNATNLIGLSVDVPGNTAIWDGRASSPMAFELYEDATSVQVTIRDEEGAAVRTITMDGQEAGLHDIAWDGMDENGNPLPAGLYTFDVVATDAEGNTVATTPLMQGLVDRVGFGPDGVVVWVNGQPIPYEQIRSIGWPMEGGEVEVEPDHVSPIDVSPEDGTIETPTPDAVIPGGDAFPTPTPGHVDY